MNKQEFFQGITKDSPCGYEFCRMMYGYGMYDNEFLMEVMERFKEYGRDKVPYVYATYLYIEERLEKKNMISAATWLKQEIDRRYERSCKEQKVEKRQQKEQSNQALMNALGWTQ